MKIRTIVSFILLLMGVAFFVSDASAKMKIPTGKWVIDAAAKKSFEGGALLPNHTYYYIGTNVGPETVIAIDNKFTLRDKHVWVKVDDMSDKVLKSWLQFYKTEGDMANDFTGGVILTSDGQKAGIWYSLYPVNIVRNPEPGVVEVFQPHPASGSAAAQD